MTSTNTTDRAIAEYLDRLTIAAAHLPADRRAELRAEIASHLEERLAGTARSEADVLNVIEAMGPPEDIVAEATAGDPAPAVRGRALWLDIVTVLLLLFGAFVVPVLGWVAGAILLWTSDTWTRRQKWMGTLLFPGGLAAVLYLGLVAAFALTVVGPTATSSFVSEGTPCVVSPTVAQLSTSDVSAPVPDPAGPAVSCDGPVATSSMSGTHWLDVLTYATWIGALIAAFIVPIFVAVNLLRTARRAATS